MTVENATLGDHDTAAVVARIVEELQTPIEVKVIHPLDNAVATIVLAGKDLKQFNPTEEEFDRFRTNPLRRVGTAKLTTLDSFVDHFNRFKTANSVAYLDDSAQAQPKLLTSSTTTMP